MSIVESEKVTMSQVRQGAEPDTLRTTVVRLDPSQMPAARRRIASVRSTDLLQIVGAVVAAFAFTTVLFQFVTPFDGPIGFVLVGYFVFIVLYAIVVWLDEDTTTVVDRLIQAIVTSLAAVLLGALAYVVIYVVLGGIDALKQWNFYTQDMSDAGPLDPLSTGGVLHAMVGTAIMITIALVIVIPIGIATAVYMNELPGRFSRFVRIVVEAMTALPSIIAGLFIYATFILILNRDKSGLAASLAISVMMLPIIIRAGDVVIRLVPGNLKEASYALGSSQLRTVWHVVLPTARSGLMTAVILGTARGVGETSPVLLTAGFTQSLNANPTNGPMISLPLAAFQFIKSSEETFKIRGFAAATVLLGLVLILFVIARIIGGRGPGQLSNRQRRRAAARSRRDAARMGNHDEQMYSADSAALSSTTSPPVHSNGSPTS